jgi:hypothetical protein
MTLSESIEIFWRSYKYLNSLEDPILDKESVGKILYAAACFKGEEVVVELQKVVARMPKASFLILKSTVNHFARLGSYAGGRVRDTLGSVFGSAMFRTTNVRISKYLIY